MIRRRYLMRSTVSLAAAVIFGLFSSFVPIKQALADSTPPIILHEPGSESVPENSAFSLSAIITDDEAIDPDAINLNFKLTSDTEFVVKKMVSEDQKTFIFKFNVDELVQPGLDYFITATDAAGNTQSSGFSYYPHKVTIGPSIPAALAKTSEGRNMKPALYVVGALLAVGLIAGLAGDGGSDPVIVGFAFN